MKGIRIAALLLVTVLLACALAGCARTDRGLELGSDFTPYDEAAFRAEIARDGEGRVLLAENGTTPFGSVIYTPVPAQQSADDDSEPDKLERAAEFLADALSKMTGAAFSAIAGEPRGGAIVLTADETADIPPEGYALSVSERMIEISSSSRGGAAYGVYAFLEEKLGCMFVSADFDYIPALPTVRLDAGESEFVPSVRWREVYSYEIDEDETGRADKLRINGAEYAGWHTWCHTSFDYLPPEEYYDEHPEYYSLYRGERVYKQGSVDGQLCWSNEEVYEIISEKVLAEMREHPEDRYWDISQMDNGISVGSGCTCGACRAIDDREGSQMGSLLTFINRLADEVKEEFPNNYVSTLAYNHTADPPATLRPRDNVIIKLCLMPGDCSASYAEPAGNYGRQAKELVEKWGKIADNLLIWDYNIDFHNYLMPYPILDYIADNNDFYLENNAYGLFHQMSRDKGGDSADLNAYLFARIMWDADTDLKAVFDKYLTVYYGAAAPYVAEYYRDMSDRLKESGGTLYIYAKPVRYATSYLSPSAADGYLELFEKAKAAVAGDETVTERIRYLSRGALFAKAVQFSGDMKGRREAIKEFEAICEDYDIVSLVEASKSADQVGDLVRRVTTEINATPVIIIAMIVAAALTLFAAAAAAGALYGKVRYRSAAVFKLLAASKWSGEKAYTKGR